MSRGRVWAEQQEKVWDYIKYVSKQEIRGCYELLTV